MRIQEITNKLPTPEQARVKALQVNADRAKQAVKAEKARQKIKQGQAQLLKVINKVE